MVCILLYLIYNLFQIYKVVGHPEMQIFIFWCSSGKVGWVHPETFFLITQWDFPNVWFSQYYTLELALCSCSFRVDAAREDGSLGRLINDDHVNPNSKIKTIRVDGKPHLCLFAIKDISPGEEITYNYGDSDWPWRSKVFTDGTKFSHLIITSGS